MSPVVALRAGGIEVRLEGPAGLIDAVRARYPDFLAEGREASLALALEHDAALDWSRPYELATEREGPRFRIRSSALEAEVDEDLGRGIARLAPPRVDFKGPNVSVLENLLRVLWARLAPARGLVLLHSAAVLDPSLGGAFLFYGRSGAGKSTSSKLSADSGRTVLSDDIVLVGPEPGGGAAVHGTPFWGDAPVIERRPIRARLLGLAELVKAPSHAVEPIPPAEALASLVANTPFTETLAPGEADRVLEILARVCAEAPSFRLFFAKDAGFWKVLGSTLP